MRKGGYIYMMTNKYHNAVYLGVTSDLIKRIYEHKHHIYKNSFTDRYNIEFLVYYELYDSIETAITREKELKKWSRQKKQDLINGFNPDWVDLYDSLF